MTDAEEAWREGSWVGSNTCRKRIRRRAGFPFNLHSTEPIALRQDRPLRKAAAMKHFREMGLTASLTLYLPKRGRHFPRAVWTSHREMARHALKSGMKRVLILEEDANFHIGAADLRNRLERAIQKLPPNWWGLFLGHFPLQIYPPNPAAAHAYLANTPLLTGWPSRAMDPANPASPRSARRSMQLSPTCRKCTLCCRWSRPSGRSANVVHPKYDENGKAPFLLDPQRYRGWALSERIESGGTHWFRRVHLFTGSTSASAFVSEAARTLPVQHANCGSPAVLTRNDI